MQNIMNISKEEMDTILVMYRIVCGEGQESDIMKGLAQRIEKGKKKMGEERVTWTARDEIEYYEEQKAYRKKHRIPMER